MQLSWCRLAGCNLAQLPQYDVVAVQSANEISNANLAEFSSPLLQHHQPSVVDLALVAFSRYEQVWALLTSSHLIIFSHLQASFL